MAWVHTGGGELGLDFTLRGVSLAWVHTEESELGLVHPEWSEFGLGSR